MKILALLLLISGCSMADIRAEYFEDDRGNCYAVTDYMIDFDVKCPPARFLDHSS